MRMPLQVRFEILRNDSQERRAAIVWGSAGLATLSALAIGAVVASSGETEAGLAIAAIGTTLLSPTSAFAANHVMNRTIGPLHEFENNQ